MKQLCKNKHWKIDEEYDLDKILYLLIDRPTFINVYYEFVWINNKGQIHREYNLPCYVYNSTLSWKKTIYITDITTNLQEY